MIVAIGQSFFRVTFVEKSQGADGHEERAGGELLLVDEIVLIGADVLRTEVLGRPAEVPGKLRHVLTARGLRLLGEVPDPHVFAHALTKRGQAHSFEYGVATIATPERVTIRGTAVKIEARNGGDLHGPSQQS